MPQEAPIFKANATAFQIIQSLCDIALRTEWLNAIDTVNALRAGTYEITPEDLKQIQKEKEKSGKKVAEVDMKDLSPTPKQ